jgi:hypothetical protein
MTIKFWKCLYSPGYHSKLKDKLREFFHRKKYKYLVLGRDRSYSLILPKSSLLASFCFTWETPDEFCFIRIKEQAARRGAQFYGTLRYADCLLKNTSTKENKFVVNQKLEQVDVISFRELFGSEFEPHSWRGVLDTTLCDKVCQWLAAGRWFSPGTPVSSTNKTDRHDTTEILLKVDLNTINQNFIGDRHCVHK